MFELDTPEDQPTTFRTSLDELIAQGVLPEIEQSDPAHLDYGQHSAGLWSEAPQLRPDGRHNIDGHPADRGQLSVDTICLQHPHVVTAAAIRVRTEDDRKAAWFRQQHANQARHRQFMDAETERFAAVTA